MKQLRLALLCIAAVAALTVGTYLVAANNQHTKNAHATEPSTDSGPLANATVSFGAWMTSPPLDRFPNVSNTRTSNHHVVIPEVAKIKAGGTVNFIIAGFHQVIIYDDGTQPET
jgi:plastocyanin